MSLKSWFGIGPPNVRAAITSGDLAAAMRGSNTAAGVSVVESTALRVGAVKSCVKVLAEGVAQLPLIVYRRTDDGKERATDHPLYTLLHDEPNGWQTSFDFRSLQQAHLALYGNAYALKTVVRGQVRELLPVLPSAVTVHQGDDWRLTYKVRSQGEDKEYPQDQVLHLRGLSTDGVIGLSPIRDAAESIGLSMQTERYGGRLFGNNARPSGVLSTDRVLNEEQMKGVAKSWNASHGGDGNLGTAVLDGGWKFSSMSIPNDDAQFLETRKFQVSDIARIFRVPPHMIGDLERATFSNVEQMSLEFVQYTLMPWLRQWEQRLTASLLTPAERGEYFIEFLVDGLLRGDAKTRAEVNQIGVQNGWLSPNDVRRMENMNPRDGGDEYNSAANIFGTEGGDNARSDQD